MAKKFEPLRSDQMPRNSPLGGASGRKKRVEAGLEGHPHAVAQAPARAAPEAFAGAHWEVWMD